MTQERKQCYMGGECLWRNGYCQTYYDPNVARQYYESLTKKQLVELLLNRDRFDFPLKEAASTQPKITYSNACIPLPKNK